MSIKAKYPGICPACKNRFKVDIDLIEKVGDKWQHVACPQVEKVTSSSRLSVPVAARAAHGVNVPLSIEDHPADESIDALASLFNAVVEDKDSNQSKSSFIPSMYQQAFFDELENVVSKVSPFLHIVVEAVAGSGKTTTLIEGIKRVKNNHPDLSVCIVAFNKHIATEFQNKLTKMLGNHDVLASTKHSLGLRAIRKHFPKVKVDDDKLGTILDNIWEVSKDAYRAGRITNEQRKINYVKRLSMRKLVSICKSVLVDVNNVADVLEVIEHYNVEIDIDLIDEIISQLPAVMEMSKSNTDIVDFDDMGWLPIVLNLSVEQYDLLMIDEAQDMSKGDMEFLFRCVKSDGHIVAVGDRYQSLYAFRGADSNAIPNIISMLGAKVLPLSVTYRCPASHVRKAQEIVPQLEARDNAPEGSITEIDYLNLAHAVQPGDMVVCRTNAPLIRPAFECIRMGKKAIIRGKDIGSSLVNLIKRFETNDLGAFEISLAEYFEHEYTKLLDKGKEMQALMLQDRVETLRFICNECSTVAELMAKIDLLFSDNNIGVVFSSVHRAKGLEAEKVYILRPELMPHPKAKKPEEQQQEWNALYVAETRSKAELIFVKGGENV